ncbi:MAG TPA: hypothetical protein VGO22_03140 [Pseudorhizobium sp.]|jgi:hypothetical protein|nr:hypothetical protein [Pseudorhizobium sp.]
MKTFRVHASGQHVDVTAENPDQARKLVTKRLPDEATITKVKVLKEKGDA